MKTFTAQDMKDYGDYVATLDSAMLSPNFEKWCRERFEPAKKVIDLSVLIESGIDCEFTDNCWQVYSCIDILTDIECTAAHPYTTDDVDLSYNKCRPRMNHIHAWQGGECPLPEGFRIKVWFRSGGDAIVTTPSRLYWGSNSETMAFEVLGLADGYVMPWEEVSQDNT